MTAEKYYADLLEGSGIPPSLNASIAKIMHFGTPREAWLAHPRLNPNYQPDDAAKFTIGKAAHNLILEGGDALQVINPEDNRNKPTKDYPDGKIPEGWTNEAMRAARDSTLELGKVPLLPSEFDQVRAMAYMAEDAMRRMGFSLSDFHKEKSIAFKIGKTHCRARLDMLRDDGNLRIDLKTTSAKTPQEWIRKYLTSMGHDIQDDFHNRAAEAETGVWPRSLFLVQQDFGEFDCFWVEMTAAKKEVARVKVERALAKWSACMAEDYWPGWPSIINEAEATQWEIAEAEEIDAEVKGFSPEAFLFGRVEE